LVTTDSIYGYLSITLINNRPVVTNMAAEDEFGDLEYRVFSQGTDANIGDVYIDTYSTSNATNPWAELGKVLSGAGAGTVASLKALDMIYHLGSNMATPLDFILVGTLTVASILLLYSAASGWPGELHG
jgi:hypothetical protein